MPLVTHLMKLAEKMCKYEIDPASIVENTEWTRFCPEIDEKMDRQMARWNQHMPLQLHSSRGHNYRNVSIKICKLDMLTACRFLKSPQTLSGTSTLSQMILIWEAKVFAVAMDMAADAVAETNWKHKFTPDWGELIRKYKLISYSYAYYSFQCLGLGEILHY